MDNAIVTEIRRIQLSNSSILSQIESITISKPSSYFAIRSKPSPSKGFTIQLIDIDNANILTATPSPYLTNKLIKIELLPFKSELFGEKIDLVCNSFDDIKRLNNDMLKIVNKFNEWMEILNPTKVMEVMDHIKSNYKTLQAYLHTLKEEVSNAKGNKERYLQEIDEINNRLTKLFQSSDIVNEEYPASLPISVPTLSQEVKLNSPLSSTPLSRPGDWRYKGLDRATGKFYVGWKFCEPSAPILEYASLESFLTQTTQPRYIHLPYSSNKVSIYQTVYNGMFYACLESSVLQYSLTTTQLIKTITLYDARSSNDGFGYGGFTTTNMLSSNGNLYIFYRTTKGTWKLLLLASDLTICKTWTINVNASLGFAFIVKGVLFMGKLYFKGVVDLAFNLGSEMLNDVKVVLADHGYISYITWLEVVNKLLIVGGNTKSGGLCLTDVLVDDVVT